MSIRLRSIRCCQKNFLVYNLQKMLRQCGELLGDHQVFIIGIYGMGRVVKAVLATYVQSEIKRNKTFKDVLWVTISHDFTIFKLQ